MSSKNLHLLQTVEGEANQGTPGVGHSSTPGGTYAYQGTLQMVAAVQP